MSNANILYPLKSELSLVNVQALEDSKSIYVFNLSAKKIKTEGDLTLAEKYPFSLETENGYMYEIQKDGGSLAKIQLSNTTGLEVVAGTSTKAKQLLPLLKIMLMDEQTTLYRTLLHQLVEKQNNQWFLFLLGLRAKRLVEGDITTVNLIDAPKLRTITGDQWIKLTCQVISDISWGYFPKEERYAIIERFQERLRTIVQVELLPIMGVNPGAFEKAIGTTFKQLEGTPNMENKEPVKEQELKNVITTDTTVINDIPESPFITETEVQTLGFEALLEVIKENSLTVHEYCTTAFKSKVQLVKYLTKKNWIKADEPMTVDTQATEIETTEPASDNEQPTTEKTTEQ